MTPHDTSVPPRLLLLLRELALALLPTLVINLLCALAVGVIASTRSRERAEQFAVAGVFTVMFAALVTVGGIASGGSSVADAVGGGLGSAGSSVGSAMPESLLFALLWSAGGVLLAPYVRRALGMAPPGAAAGPVPPQPSPYAYAPTAYPYPSPSPYVPQQAPPQEREVHDLGVVQPDRLAKEEDRTRREEGGGRHL